MILRRLFDRRRAGFYVDVGAHHPLRFSNTYFFYRQGWSGINIEPNPEAALPFLFFRPRDLHVQMGVNEAAGMMKYYCFSDAALNTFDSNLAHKREQVSSNRIVDVLEIAVDRLDAILDQRLPAGKQIDFLSVDVEGLDLAVLRSNDWTRFRPRCVLAEALGLSSLAELPVNEIACFLQATGYEFFAKSFNTLFFRDSRWTRPV